MNRRGFALVTAIFLLMLFAGAAVVVSRSILLDARRTTELRSEAQFEQLLISGEIIAAQSLKSAEWTTGQREQVAVPDLPQAQVSLSCPLSTESLVRLHVRAQIGERSRAQSLEYARKEGTWTLVRSTLDQ